VSRLEAVERAASEGALTHARPDLGVFAVTGPDRLTWLNGLVTQDVGKLAPGAGAYGLAVGKTGKIMAELWFVAAADRVFVVLGRDRLATIREHFDRHLIMEDAELGEPLDRGVVFVHGARARALVDAARALGADAALVAFTGRGDAAVLIAPGRDVAALLALGTPLPEEAWEPLRVAWGLGRFGVDFDDQTLPQEASLEKLAVCFTKGCYLGQEAVFMLEKRGHAKKHLVRLAVEGADPPAAGAEITAEGSAVGAVTSATAALTGEGQVALGYVKHKLAVAGTEVAVGGRPGRVLGPAAEIVTS
jgi:folate-binding protein YgfZ